MSVLHDRFVRELKLLSFALVTSKISTRIIVIEAFNCRGRFANAGTFALFPAP